MDNSINLTLYAHEKEMRAFCSNRGLTMVFENEHHPRTDGSRVYVGKPDPLWNDDELTVWKYSIYHEIGHNVKEMRDCFDVPKKYKIDMLSFIGVCLNVIDDYRQEHFKYDEYYGRQQVMSKGCSIMQDKIFSSDKFATSEDLRFSALETLMVWQSELREDWMKDVIGQASLASTKLSAQQKDWLAKLQSGNYKDVLNNTPTAEEEYALVKRIIKEVFELDPEEEEQLAQQAAKGKEGQNGSDDEEENEDGKTQVDSKVRYEDLLMHIHDEANMETGTSYASLEIDYTDFTKRSFKSRPASAMCLINYKETGARNINPQYSRHIMEKASASGLVKQLKKLLQVYKQHINIHGQKKGRMSKKSVYRATMKDMDGYNQKIFRKKVESTILDSSVLVLVDGSGSMGGDKFTCAARTAILLNSSIASLGMPVEIIGFSERTVPIHAVYKAFNEMPTAEEIANRFSDFADQHMGSNSDGESILWALPRLLAQPTTKKIMIVLSDGQPASNGGDAMTFTQKVVKEIERNGNVDIYGIGIQSNEVKSIYKNHYVIKRPEEIETAVFSIIKHRLL